METVTVSFVPLTNDILFKEMFGRAKHAFILEFFLELFLHLKIGTLKGKLKFQMECTLEKSKFKDKNSRGDNLIVMDDKIIDLEMFSNFDYEDLCKVLFYTSRVYGTSLDSGAFYQDAKPLISINIIDHVASNKLLFEDFESKYGFCYQTHQLSDKITIVFIRLDILRNIPYNEDESDFITFMRFIGAKSLEEREKYAKKGGEILMSANRLIEKFMNDEEANEMFSMENKIKETGMSIGRAEGRTEGRAEGRVEGRIQGRAEGSADEKNSIAQKMLKRNCDYSFISEMTGLSTPEIETLQQKLITT